MGGKPRKNALGPTQGKVGRPPRSPAGEGKLAQWIEKSGQTRESVAQLLRIGRPHLDALCREDRRPSIQLAIKINELAGDDVPLSYFASLRRKKD